MIYHPDGVQRSRIIHYTSYIINHKSTINQRGTPRPYTIHQKLYIIHYTSYIKNMKKELWQKIIQFAITILTAIATTLGTTSCIDLMR